jgi:pimeloyl-ACP methyl ester carboxylesterase
MGKMLADHRRGLDYLASLPFVDPARMGAIGHSLGAYNSYFLSAFDERVRAVVVSCGFDVMAGAERPFAWARRGWFVHFPKLAPYLRAGILPFDFHEVLALAAPRAAFVYAARQDTIFADPANIEAAAAQVRAVYAMLGREDRFRFVMGDGPHSFPPAIRQQAYRWLEDQLR